MNYQPHPPAFILSRTLQALGHPLTATQATVLDAAQVIRQQFMRRSPVNVCSLFRVLRAYHDVQKAEAIQALSELAALGILKETPAAGGSPRTISLTLKLKGLAADEVTKESAGIGSLVVAPEPPPTVRELCESEDYRQSLCERYLKPGAVCSVHAAMVLAEIVNRAGIDQADLTKLSAFFIEGLLTSEDFCSACEELESLGAIEILRNRHSQLMVKLKRPVESVTSLSVREVLAVA
jgi:hypothetical protein